MLKPLGSACTGSRARRLTAAARMHRAEELGVSLRALDTHVAWSAAPAVVGRASLVGRACRGRQRHTQSAPSSRV